MRPLRLRTRALKIPARSGGRQAQGRILSGGCALALVGATLLSSAAAAAEPEGGSRSPAAPTRPPKQLPATPAGFEVSARAAVAVAGRDSVVDAEAQRHGVLATVIEVSDDGGAWQVGYRDGEVEVAQVIVDGASGEVRESWTGDQVAWPMARGYEGQFGHVLNAPYVWLPLCAVFLLGLLDWHRPLRVAHLDLIVLLGFSISHLFFNAGEIELSVPLVYPMLLYLLVRTLWLGFRGGEGLRPSIGARWLGIAAVVLIAFRLTINVADSGVIDVGYAGAVGADRIAGGQPLYGEGEFPDDNPFGDTYGPANYFAYVPFELALPWSGSWDELPAAHAAAIAFDLATVAGLCAFGLGLRPGHRGRELAATLAFAWVAFPYTAFALQSNSNDTLVAALLAWSLALFARPLARGALLALATLTKFAPVVLAPLYATGERSLLEGGARGRRPALAGLRPPLAFAGAFLAAAALVLTPPAIDPGLAVFFDRTLGNQLERESPFSIWGQVDGIDWLQILVSAATAGLAIALAFVPRRRTIAQLAALAAALVIAVELTVDHWFYLYIPWFLPALLIALVTAARVPRARPGHGRAANG